jgi:hypothetical protein
MATALWQRGSYVERIQPSDGQIADHFCAQRMADFRGLRNVKIRIAINGRPGDISVDIVPA